MVDSPVSLLQVSQLALGELVLWCVNESPEHRGLEGLGGGQVARGGGVPDRHVWPALEARVGASEVS